MFQFKQFTIQQDQCAIKVCTDSCLFGAWVAERLVAENTLPSHILDVGTGTGLLTLMLAQKLPSGITAVEIESNAAAQAINNVHNSPWSTRIVVENKDVTGFYPGKQFDLVIINPPFFENDLKSRSSKNNLAKHDEGLTLANIVEVTNRLCSEDGLLAVMLPYSRMKELQVKLEPAGFFPKYVLNVRQTPKHPFFRSMIIFSHKASTPSTEEIIIRKADGNYSEEFVNLLKDYYLYL